MSDTSMLELRKCCRPLDLSDGIIPTKLYSTNRSVDEENQAALKALPDESVCFRAHEGGSPTVLQTLEKNCPAKNEIELKIGAQVVLLRKVESLDGLVNGSRGVVIGFADGTKKRGKFHTWYTNNAKVPIIRFTDGTEATVPPIEWDVWNGERAFRHQLPLKLAWALTIHRAQGMTLDKVECKLSEAFAPGQAYVALSRVRQLDGLYLRDFDRRAIRVSHSVLQFYKRMIKDKNFQSSAPAASASEPINRAYIRSGNSGNIKSFSEEKGMLVRPVGQRIINPSSSLAIGPGLKFASNLTKSTTTSTSSTISKVNSLQTISAYYNKNVHQIAVNTISHIQAKGRANQPHISAAEAYETNRESYETNLEASYEALNGESHEEGVQNAESQEVYEESEGEATGANEAYEYDLSSPDLVLEGEIEANSHVGTYTQASSEVSNAHDSSISHEQGTEPSYETTDSNTHMSQYRSSYSTPKHNRFSNGEYHPTQHTHNGYSNGHTQNGYASNGNHTYSHNKSTQNEAQNGLKWTQNGTKQAQNGAKQTQNGAKQTQNGAKQTQNGAKQTQNGAKQTQNGAKQTQNGGIWAQNGLKPKTFQPRYRQYDDDGGEGREYSDEGSIMDMLIAIEKKNKA